MGFFDSKYFVISGIVAMLILAGGALSYNVIGRSFSSFTDDGCSPRTTEGAPLTASRGEEDDPGTTRRIVSYSLPSPPSLQGGTVDACVIVGEILVTAAPGDTAELVFTIEGPAQAVADTRVEAAFAQNGGKLAIAAWEELVGVAGTIMSRSSAEVRLEVRLPATGAYDIDAVMAVGDIRATDLLVGEVDLAVDVGDIVATGLDSMGNTTLATDVGAITLHFASVQSSTIEAHGDVADVEVRLPQRAEIGYDVRAQSDVGDVDVEIGPREHYVRDADNGPGAEVEARSQDYAAKPTRVVAQATTGVGNVIVKAN